MKFRLEEGQRQHSHRDGKNRELQERMYQVWRRPIHWEKQVPEDLRLPEPLRQMSSFGHPKNKDGYQHDGLSVDTQRHYLCDQDHVIYPSGMKPISIASLRLHSILKIYKSKSFGLKCPEDSKSQVPTLRSVTLYAGRLLYSRSFLCLILIFSPTFIFFL